MRLARAEGLRVKARSGGHSWTASSVRDGMLIDLEALDEITVDPGVADGDRAAGRQGRGPRRSTPRRTGSSSRAATARRCASAATSSRAGFGWNGRLHGPACASVRAVNVVTAAGELDPRRRDDELRRALGRSRLGQRLLRRRDAIHDRGLRAAEGDLPQRVRLPARRSSTRCSASRWRCEDRLPANVEFALLGTTPRLPGGRLRRGRHGARRRGGGALRDRGGGARRARAARGLPRARPRRRPRGRGSDRDGRALRRRRRARARRVVLRARQHVDERRPRRADPRRARAVHDRPERRVARLLVAVARAGAARHGLLRAGAALHRGVRRLDRR